MPLKCKKCGNTHVAKYDCQAKSVADPVASKQEKIALQRVEAPATSSDNEKEISHGRVSWQTR